MNLEAVFAWINSRFPADDKCRHFITGTLGALLTAWFGLWISVPVVIATAVGKELWDAKHPPHQSDPWDTVATVLGALPVWIVWGLR